METAAVNPVRSICVSLALLLPSLALATEVQTGSTRDEVFAEYGSPRGQAAVGGRQILYYPRGEIELQSGVVTRVALLSEEKYAEQQARQAAFDERMQSMNVEGQAIKEQRLADPTFQKASPTVQLAYWQDFIRRYPGVSCADQIALARAQIDEQRAAERVHAEQERLALEEANRQQQQQHSTVYGVDPYLYGGYGYGYGYSGYRTGYGRRDNHGRYVDCPVPTPRRRPGNTGNGLFSADPIVAPFSPSPIVAPFSPPSRTIEFASSTDIWPASRQSYDADVRQNVGSRRYR